MNAQSFARRTEQKVSVSGQEIPSLSPFAKWAIVIIVPLLVVAITVSIYFARGLDRQYVYYINQAHAQIQAAKSSATQGEQRQALVQAVVWLNQAREFNQGDTEEIIKMRNEAQGQLDKMDNVRRLMLSNALETSSILIYISVTWCPGEMPFCFEREHRQYLAFLSSW